MRCLLILDAILFLCSPSKGEDPTPEPEGQKYVLVDGKVQKLEQKVEDIDRRLKAVENGFRTDSKPMPVPSVKTSAEPLGITNGPEMKKSFTPVPDGWKWENTAAGWGLRDNQGNWYLPPRQEYAERLDRGEWYVPTPGMNNFPRGYWGNNCIKDDNCRVIACYNPSVGQHGLPLSTNATKLATEYGNSFNPNDYPDGLKRELTGCDRNEMSTGQGGKWVRTCDSNGCRLVWVADSPTNCPCTNGCACPSNGTVCNSPLGPATGSKKGATRTVEGNWIESDGRGGYRFVQPGLNQPSQPGNPGVIPGPTIHPSQLPWASAPFNASPCLNGVCPVPGVAGSPFRHTGRK